MTCILARLFVIVKKVSQQWELLITFIFPIVDIYATKTCLYLKYNSFTIKLYYSLLDS